ncbi:MAG: hypothetical protein ACW98K_14565 [Candidatus Kariarchaeaceae archaeon]|jgi:hypothetical protein
MSHSDSLLQAYANAREWINSKFGTTPEDYKVLLFIDPTLFESVVLQTSNAGSPRAIISSNELEILQEMKEEKYAASGMDLFYGSRSPKLFLPEPRMINQQDAKVIEAKFIHFFAKALLTENTKSRFPDHLEKLYKYDAIIQDLFTNNVYEFVRERTAPWIWQYFQDFSAVMRSLSLYNLDDFYVPPANIRSASIFYNYLLEIKSIIKSRSNQVVKSPLLDLVIQGFGDLVLTEYLEGLEQGVSDRIQPLLKANVGQPIGVVGKQFLREHGESIEDIYESAIAMESDIDLVKVWNRKTTKQRMEETRENLSTQSRIWYSSKTSYWSDLWPLRANQFDKATTYVGKIQRRGYKQFSDLLQDKPIIQSHGRVVLSDRDVVVLSIQEDTVGQEQLLILRNHLQARKDTFTTPLPGLPDVIVFKKFAGMHVASYLGVADGNSFRHYPQSPYDLPLVVRAVQVTRRKDAYMSKEREDEGKIDQANYENLEKLTDPQHRALRYLIRQGEITQ